MTQRSQSRTFRFLAKLMFKLKKKEEIRLLDFLLECGLFKDDIVCVFLEGSYLYVKEPRDMDFVVITKNRPLISKPLEGMNLVIRGLHVDVNILSLEQFHNIYKTWIYQFYHEEEDWVPLYGDPSMVERRKLTPELLAREASSFDTVLFHPESKDFNAKRLVTFFVLARKMGIEISDELMEKAHKEELDPANYKWLFNKLFTNYSPKVHHEN